MLELIVFGAAILCFLTFLSVKALQSSTADLDSRLRALDGFLRREIATPERMDAATRPVPPSPSAAQATPAGRPATARPVARFGTASSAIALKKAAARLTWMAPRGGTAFARKRLPSASDTGIHSQTACSGDASPAPDAAPPPQAHATSGPAWVGATARAGRELAVGTAQEAWEQKSARPEEAERPAPGQTVHATPPATPAAPELPPAPVRELVPELTPELTPKSAPAFASPSLFDALFDSLFTAIINFVRAGNLWVAGGVIMLLIGFAFLVTYMSDVFILELRIAASAVAGMIMVGFGLYLRGRKGVYALILQGGGIGVLYLSAFAAAKLPEPPMLPPLAALALMSLLLVPSVFLALLQQAQILALFGFLGGFAAPILLSSGSGDYVALFSCYSLLNLALLGICRFRIWRWLNLLGASCSFGVMAVWGMRSYQPSLFATVEPFLLAFTAIYLLITLISVHKQEFSFSSPPDILLALGVPFAAALFQWRLAAGLPHGLSLSALAFGAFFIALAALIWKRWGTPMRRLAEIYLAGGVVLANLSLPLEFTGQITSGVWAAEGALLFWFACRTHSRRVKLIALLLQIAAMLMFICGWPPLSPDHHTIAESGLIALAALASAIAHRKERNPSPAEREDRFSRAFDTRLGPPLSRLLALTGLFWWYAGLAVECWRFFAEPAPVFFFCGAVSVAAFLLVGSRFALRELYAAGCVLLVHGIAHAFFSLVTSQAPPALDLLLETPLSLLKPMLAYQFLDAWGAAGWLAFTLTMGVFFRVAGASLSERARSGALTAVLLLLLLVLTCSCRAFAHALALSRAWISFAGLFPALAYLCAAVWFVERRSLAPVDREAVFARVPVVLFSLLGAWFVGGMFRQGSPAPLPLYIPLLNPLEIKQALCVGLFLLWQHTLPLVTRRFPLLAAPTLARLTIGLTFVWLHSIIARTTHFYAGVPLHAVWGESVFQVLLTLLWGLCGMAGIIIGNKRKLRVLWMAGAGLVALDTAKLFLLDLADKGTLFRIISFFIVGGVFLLIGLLAPLPPAAKPQPDNPGKEAIPETEGAARSPEQGADSQDAKTVATEG